MPAFRQRARLPVHPLTPPPRLPPSSRRARTPVWNLPLRPGRVPAYDEALNYIRADSRALTLELESLKQQYARTAADDARAGRSHDVQRAKEYRERRDLLDVMRHVNLPEVRSAFRSGRFPFSKPVYRHLTEQKWRQGGTLDLLMERLYQLHVIPDLLPSLRPTIDLRVQFRTLEGMSPSIHTDGFVPVIPGTFLHPAQSISPPRVSATVFHREERLYTMMLLDPDVPDEAKQTFQTYIHWLIPNIPISGTRRISFLPSDSGEGLLPYLPPHPQKGTGYHRYVLFLLGQEGRITPAAPESREKFDVREFCGRWGLDVGEGGGHMWREEWSEIVGEIYRDVFGVSEPRYGRRHSS